MARSRYEHLEDGKVVAAVEGCVGLLAFSDSEPEARDELRSSLEEWVLLGLKLGHELPVLNGIDLNGQPALEPVDTL